MTNLIEPLTQFGSAGLMGALWICERLLSRKREAQLNEAHDQLMRQERELSELIELVRHNTRAMKAAERTQLQLKSLLERIQHDLERKTAA